MDIVGKGFWIQISSRFAAESTCDACLLCVNARDDWIFERDELYNGLQRLWQCTIQNYTLTIRAITLARHIRNRIGGNCKRYNTPEHTYSTKYGLYEEISKLGDFQDIINSSKLSIGEILITKTGDGKITISRLGDLPGEGIRNGTIGKVIENKAGISGIKKITNSEQGIQMDFGDFTVEETDLSKFEKSNALTNFEKYGNYTEYVTADGQVVNVSKYVNRRTNTFKIIGVVGTVVFTIESGKTLCDAINKAMDGDIRQANKEICGWAGASIGAINTMVYVSSAITPVCTGLEANGIGVIPAIGLELLIVGAAGIIGGIIGGVGGGTS